MEGFIELNAEMKLFILEGLIISEEGIMDIMGAKVY
jgi:hypothetical protein